LPRKYPNLNKAVSRLSRADWLATARDTLIAEGKSAVKVQRLAKKLKVARSGFYWHFRDLDDLLNALLKSWEHETNLLFEKALEGDHADGMREYLTLARHLVEEKIYDPRYDAAVRDWARGSKPAAKAVKRVDRKRIEIIKRIFMDIGYEEEEALIRSRIAYYHQIGHYTLGIDESKSQRRKLVPLYIRVLIGREVKYEDVFPDV